MEERMNEPEVDEEERLLLRPPTSDVPPPPSNTTEENSVDEKPPPHSSDPGSTLLEPQIVAILVPDEGDQVKETMVAQEAEEGEVVMGADVNNHDDSSPFCGFKKPTLLLLGILALLMIIGGVTAGVLSSPSAVPVVSRGDPLLEELILLNATSEKDLSQFSDPSLHNFKP
jgi:hypothetical protein